MTATVAALDALEASITGAVRRGAVDLGGQNAQVLSMERTTKAVLAANAEIFILL